jgi:hypothetical protein
MTFTEYVPIKIHGNHTVFSIKNISVIKKIKRMIKKASAPTDYMFSGRTEVCHDSVRQDSEPLFSY